jgi:tetratricopeptide (TPR) repeat protein
MRKNWLILLLLLVTVFGLSSWIEPWFQRWAGNRSSEANLLAVALGDSRKLFARHIYVKADAYFHNGFYPSIFDYNQDPKGSFLSQQIGLQEQQETACKMSHVSEPRDWIERFGRNFYPSRHSHLGESLPHPDHQSDPHNHGSDHDATRPEGLEREILPWLRFSAGLDPNRVETFVVAAYWLRKELAKTDEAEQFLREGLRANPGSQEILFELGRIYYEDRKDFSRARNLWELALQSWEKNDANQDSPNVFLYAQILGNLSRLEDEQKNYAQAIVYLEKLAQFSPHAATIRQWIVELRQKQNQP